MRHRPLNADTSFELWPHFEPGRFIDFNPSFVRLPSGQAYAVIRRDRVPPVPGRGTVWAVAVDGEMCPGGSTFALVADGEDPRAVVLGEHVLVFYVRFERDADARITGTSMVLAEFDASSEPWQARAHFKLPKYPLGGAPADSHPGWEKNWVPFVISDRQVGLIYSHDPWQVIVLDVAPHSSERRFEQAYKAEGLRWAYGGIRGGTPPLAWDDGELITFFHSSEVVGSRKSYLVGACVFEAQAPYRPLHITTEPLLASPYHGGMHRHGWAVAASVIFPLGCDAMAGGYRLLCGIDDGQIGSFVVPASAVRERLQALPRAASASVAHPAGGTLAASEPLLLQPPWGAIEPAADLALLRFARMAAGSGRTLLDVGGDAGLFASGLAAGFKRVESVATTAAAAGWRARNFALNGLANVTQHLPRPAGTPPAEAAAVVARAPWTLATLDDAAFIELDLVTLAVDDTATALRGLVHALARDRPPLLLQLAADGSDRAAVVSVLAELGYPLDAVFPRTPRAALAVHPSRRAEMAWFY